MKTNILIIGGGPAGIVSAITARKNNFSKKIVLVRNRKREIIPCGIPYIFKRLNSVKENLVSDKILEKNKIDLIIGQAIEIEENNKKVFLKNGKNIEYDKLILATGSVPNLIPIEGIRKKGVWFIKKDFEYLEKLRRDIIKSKNIVIIGGGFIGMEIAEELSSIKKLNISIVEKLAHCLITTFDKEFAILAEERLKQKKVDFYTKISVKKIIGENRVEAVKLDNGKIIPADSVILSIGAKPNISLIKKTGIRTGSYGGILVDRYMKTSVSDIFAVGDCAETKDFFTEKQIPIMLASTATTEARIAATDFNHLKNLKNSKGTLSIFSTYINGLVLAGVGITEDRAKKESFDVIIGESECANHHPKTLPNTKNIKVKLIFSKTSKCLLGAQIAGPENISEMINMLGLAIQRELNVFEFNVLQISTHPLLTASPVVYPLITATQSVLTQID